MPDSPTRADLVTIVDVARFWAVNAPQRRAFVFLADGEREEPALTYGELDRRARLIAAAIRSHGPRDTPVLLMHPPGPEYVCALLGALYAGAVTVPVYPARSPRALARLQPIARDAGAGMILTSRSLLDRMRPTLAETPALGSLTWLATDDADRRADDGAEPGALDPDAVALIQYTSGSTGTPRGVMLSHAAMMRQQRLLFDRMGHSRDESRVVTWLPPYHDMGLIGGLLQPLYGGFECIWIAPAAFLLRPMRWLRAVSRYRATTSGGPNFSFDLCVRSLAEDGSADLDLRHWRVAFNGSETVRHDTMQRFAEAFSRYGFRADAFFPCYGLAEATLMVTGARGSQVSTVRADRPGLQEGRLVPSADAKAATLVGCGTPAEDQAVVIVDPLTRRRRAANEIGEVWIAGAGLGLGYWRRPDQTTETFRARLAEGDDAAFLRTGDLGFLHDGQLFIAERIKDVVIVRGRNYYALDVEATAAAVDPSVRPNSTAAIAALVDGEERAVIVQEVGHASEDTLSQLAAAIRRAVADEHDLALASVVLIRSGTLPKTSSGKVQRHALAKAYGTGELRMLREVCFDRPLEPSAGETWDPDGDEDVTAAVRRIWAACVGSAEPADSDRFLDAGGDSLQAARVIARINRRFSVALPQDAVFDAPTPRELARLVMKARLVPMPSRAPQRPPPHPPMLSAQKRIWFLEQLTPGNAFYHVAARLEIRGPLDTTRLQTAFQRLLEAHEALRATFLAHDGEPRQIIHPAGPFVLEVSDARRAAREERDASVARLADDMAVRPFDLAGGPLLRAQLIRTAERDWTLLLAVHHIVCDGVSLGVILADVGRLYADATNHGEASAEGRLRYSDYCVRQEERARSTEMEQQRRYWRSLFMQPPPLTQLPTDFPRSPAASTRGGRVSGEIAPALAARLGRMSAEHGVTPFMTMLCALAMVLHRRVGSTDLVIGTAAANRDGPDAETLVGCLINFLALRLDLGGDPTVRELLTRVRRTCRDAYRNQQYPFEQLVADLKPARRLSRNPLYTVGFWLHNYPMPSAFGTDLEVSARLVATETSELDLRVVASESPAGGLSLHFEYSRDLFHEHTIESLLREYLHVLESMLDDPARRLSTFTEGGGKTAAAPADRDDASPLRLSLDIWVAANFTAEPIEEFIAYWMAEIGIHAAVSFAPYNQIVQQLLGGAHPASSGARRVDLIAIDPGAWLGAGGAAHARQALDDTVRAFNAAVRHASAGCAACLVYLFPPSADRIGADGYGEALSAASASIATACAPLPNVLVVDVMEAAARWGVRQVRDPFTDELGNIPFTDELFAAAATDAARRIRSMLSTRRKVIVLDCDDTLWDGACGEGEASVSPPHRVLQELMLEQQRTGMLLALVSKNHEQDVMSMLSDSGCVLRPEHFVAMRINWLPKSANMRSLADQLGLSLNSFIFVDNDAVECREVAERCPEVLTVHLPREAAKFPKFLRHVWAFDRWGRATEEDGRRTAMYHAEQHRAALRRSVPSVEEFLAGLQVDVAITPAGDGEWTRIAQLTKRTSQFNVTGMACSEDELRQSVDSGARECRVVRVSDVYGDYGAVGVLLVETALPSLRVDVFVLSCRALGRGVEERMLASIKELAIERGAREIVIPFRPTDRNRPALEFISRVCGVEPELLNEPRLCIVPADAGPVAPNGRARLETRAAAPAASTPPIEARAAETGAESEILMRIAAEAHTAADIVAAARSRRKKRPPSAGVYVAPATALEHCLAAVWSELLNVEPIGSADDFFAFGGNSLVAVRVLARVRNEFGVPLSLAGLFESPTVTGMAEAITTALVQQADPRLLAHLVDELAPLSDREAIQLLTAERSSSARKEERA